MLKTKRAITHSVYEDAMLAPVDCIHRFYELAESFVTDPAAYEDVLHPEARFTEHPNVLAPKGRQRDRAEALEGMAMGGKLLREHRFEMHRVLGSGEVWTVECTWRGTMAVDAGPLKQDQMLVAHVCAFFEFRAGTIFHVTNYDCYEPLGSGPSVR